MRTIPWTLFFALTVTTACTSGGKGDDTDTDVATDDTDGTSADDESEDDGSDDEPSDDTDDTDDTDVPSNGLPGRAITLTNPGFEDQGLDAGGDAYESFTSGPKLVSNPLVVPGWSFAYDINGGIGIIRPPSTFFGASEPLAAPAGGNHTAFLDVRSGDLGVDGTASFTQVLPETFDEGDVLHLAAVFSARIDNSSVSPFETVRLAVRVNGQVVTDTVVSVGGSGAWLEGSHTHTITAEQAGEEVAVTILGEQLGTTASYHQVYIDEVRVSVE